VIGIFMEEVLQNFSLLILEAFEKELWKATASFVLSDFPSVRLEQLGSHWRI
jgi:hypothetical protein